MERRRFLAALALAGAPSILRSEDAQNSEAKSQPQEYEVETTLYSGTIPNATAYISSKGTLNYANASGRIELDPKDGYETKALLGEFASFDTQREADMFWYPLLAINLLESTYTPASQDSWGGEISPTSLAVLLPPFKPTPNQVQFPLAVEIKSKGQQSFHAEAKPNDNTKALKELGYTATYTAVFGGKDEPLLASQILNQMEAAGTFQVVVRDAKGKKIADIAFAGPSLVQTRHWAAHTIKTHVADIKLGKGKVVKKSKTRTGGGAACYLTTATVSTIGLGDNCWELETLRRFRDKVLLKNAKGQKLVDTYYQLAPKIVSAINAKDDANRIWLKTYFFGILPSALAAKLKLNRLAIRIYCSMTRRLQRHATSQCSKLA